MRQFLRKYIIESFTNKSITSLVGIKCRSTRDHWT